MKNILGNTWKKSLYVAAKMIQKKPIQKILTLPCIEKIKFFK